MPANVTQSTARPTKIYIVDAHPLAFVSRGRVYDVCGWHFDQPRVQFDHGQVGYISSETLWREASE